MEEFDDCRRESESHQATSKDESKTEMLEKALKEEQERNNHERSDVL